MSVHMHTSVKHGRCESFHGYMLSITALVLFGIFRGINSVPLNVVNMEGMGLVGMRGEEGMSKLRADYGFYAADNQSSFKGDSYLDIIAANSDSHLMKARSSNALQRSGCRYKATIYASGENVPTDESCLFCHCKGSVVVCKLRVCPEVPDPPPPGCIIVQKANKCCSQLVCHDNQLRKLAREQRLSSEANATETLPPSALQTLEQACLHEGTLYAEGSAMRSSTLCEHCFCIHGKMKCSSPQCLIPLNGCRPRYRSYACCPTNYDCNKSNQTAILKTTPASTQIPHFLKGCTIGGRYIPEGDPILPMELLAAEHNSSSNSLGSGGSGIGRCQTCFCMGGVVHCRPLACDRPIEGCRPVIADGHCCPDRYECDKPAEEDEATTTTMTANDLTEMMEMTTATPLPDISSSTQIYELRFEKVPLFSRKEDDEEEEEEAWIAVKKNTTTSAAKKNKQARISYTSIGGFKNGRVGNKDARGSREQRRKANKERSEFLPRSFYDDDAKEEDSSISFENSNGRSDEHSSQVLEEKSEASTSTEELPTSETDPSVMLEIVTDKTEMPTPLSSNDEGKDSKIDSVSEPEIIETTEIITNYTQSNLDTEDDEADDILPLTLTNDLKLEAIPARKISTSSPTTTDAVVILGSTSPVLEFSLSSNPTPTMNSTPTTSAVTSTTVTSTFTSSENASGLAVKDGNENENGKLEFISFGMEDAVFSPINETRYEIYPGQGASSLPKYNLVARQGSLIPSSSASQQDFYDPFGTSTTTMPNLTLTTNSRPIVLDEPPLTPLRLQQAPLEELESISISEPVSPPQQSNVIIIPVKKVLIPPTTPVVEPIVFVQEELHRNTIMDVPVQTSLYNNGHYGQGSIGNENDDDSGKDMELIITQAELGSSPTPEAENVSTTPRPPVTTTTTKLPKIFNKRPEQPLTVISSNHKFIPSFLPITLPSSSNNEDRNPSRTYSKFGIQDSSHRYGYNPNNGGGGGQDDSFFTAPPTPMISLHYHQNVNNNNNPPNLMNRKVPNFPNNSNPTNRLGYHNNNNNNKNNNNNPFQHIHTKPTIAAYDNESDEIDEEDDDKNSDNNGSEEEFASYESYLNPNPTSHSSHGDIKPINPIVTSPSNNPPPSQQVTTLINNSGGSSAFGQRYGMPQQSGPSIPIGPGAGPIPMISISGTKVSLSSKDKTTTLEGGPPGTKTKFVNSKPLRRPPPIEDPHHQQHQHLSQGQDHGSGDPLGFKPVVAFPFAIPKSQDKFNLGLKLSGCNIYGKMHGIGQTIHELSSICVQCKCTEVGVQCSELQC